MKPYYQRMLRLLAGHIATAACMLFTTGPPNARAQAPPTDAGAEVLTRGPIHEAFAETITFKPLQGLRVPLASPALIEELPPDQRPAGDNIAWIPGYWAWDDEGSSFIWVSGIWRNLPPGRQWMPGFWTRDGAEFQWISGYWADVTAEEVEYFPEPPASLEAGPNSVAPSGDHMWIPGSWLWRDSRYRWRPGTWITAQPDWVWIPSYYAYTPYGYVYVDGYWDYSIARRGMLFAPVRFTGDHYSRPGYLYHPQTVISLAALAEHLFLRPRHRHYYFGDYYDPSYRLAGYYPSSSYGSGRHGYDPIYAYNRWTHRNDSGWKKRNEDNFQFFVKNRNERPPHTLSAFQQFAARPGAIRRLDTAYAAPLARLADTKETALQLQSVNEQQRRQHLKQAREIRDFSDQRRQLGTRAAHAAGTAKPATGAHAGPTRMKTPRSPAAAKVSARTAPADIPPQRPGLPQPEQSAARPPRKPDHEDRPDPTEGNQSGKKPKQQPTDPGSVPRRVQPDQEPKHELRPEPKKERKQEPKQEPKHQPKREPKQHPKQEPKHEPKEQPKHQPKKEPKHEPKHQPKREPKREPKQQPKQEPKHQPKEQPKHQPKKEPKEMSQPGEGDSEKPDVR